MNLKSILKHLKKMMICKSGESTIEACKEVLLFPVTVTVKTIGKTTYKVSTFFKSDSNINVKDKLLYLMEKDTR